MMPMVDLRIAEAPDPVAVSSAREAHRQAKRKKARRQEQEHFERMAQAAQEATVDKRLAAVKDGRVWKPQRAPSAPPAYHLSASAYPHPYSGVMGTSIWPGHPW